MTINENADQRVLAVLGAQLRDLMTRDRHDRHHGEGPDDTPAHIRTGIICVTLSLPVAGGALLLCTW